MSRYYVYKHTDPDTKEIVYVGMGQSGRAWLVGKTHAALRSDGHNTWADLLLDQGKTPDEFVEIIDRGLEHREALAAELSLIKNLRPRFNRNFSRPTKLTKDQVELAKLLQEDGLSYAAIGKELEVSPMTAYRAIKGQTLAHTER